MKHLRVAVIPDLNGRDIWKNLIDEKKGIEKYIFLGDYCNSPDLPSEEIVSNFKEIIEFKKSNPDRVELLLGNRDIEYLFSEYRSQETRTDLFDELQPLFVENKDLFKVAFEYNRHLFTHAGVSNSWHKKHEATILEHTEKLNDGEEKVLLSDVLNSILNSQQNNILFEMGTPTPAGTFRKLGGIVWADKEDIKHNALINYKQFVAHSPVGFVTCFDNEISSITFTNCMNSNWEDFKIFKIK